MSKADEAEKILAWVFEDAQARADEGVQKFLALGVNLDDGGPETVRVASVGQSLAMLAEAAKIQNG